MSNNYECLLYLFTEETSKDYNKKFFCNNHCLNRLNCTSENKIKDSEDEIY